VGLRRFVLVALVVGTVFPAGASADALVYRCGPNICRAAPNGTGKHRLTTDGKPGGPLYAWVSATADGSRMAVVNATYTYVLDGKGRRISDKLPRSGAQLIAEISPSGAQIATVDLVPEYLGSPPILHFQPYLFVMKPDGSERETTSRGPIDTGWLGPRLVRTDTGSAPFADGICLLVTNVDFQCERDVARDPTHDLTNPAFSPDGTLVAVVQGPGPADPGAGPIVIYDTATAAPVRQLVGGENTQPTWSPDGKQIAFEHGGDIYVVGAAGGKPRRVLRGGQQPVWTTAAACRSKPRLKPRGHALIVTACAPRPGRLTVTLRRNGKPVAHKTVRVATGRLVKVRFSRPAGKLSVRTHFSG
jgi:dipeptidyl aminopeptidase/acylaminoacyl peptidase